MGGNLFCLKVLFIVFGILIGFQNAQAGENPVVPGGKLGEFRHGTYPSPSIGDFTHPGVDIVAPCGSDIYAYMNGQVVDVVNSKSDKNFDSLGYMVLIQQLKKRSTGLSGLFEAFKGRVTRIDRDYYIIYLHMQEPPEVQVGDKVSGGETKIGKVGDSGKTIGGCHTHFEIRHFPGRFSKWGNIYGPGDQRESEYFKDGWSDPVIKNNILALASPQERKAFASGLIARYQYIEPIKSQEKPKVAEISEIKSVKKEEKTNEPNPAFNKNNDSIEMKDGTIFTGSIISSSLKFKTKYGTIEVNADSIISFNKGVLILNDQSKLIGDFQEGNLTIETSDKKLDLPILEVVALSTEASSFPSQISSNHTQKKLFLEKSQEKQKVAKEPKVEAWPNNHQLDRDPFQYQDKVIAIAGFLTKMTSPNEGIFNGAFLISGIPESSLKTSRRKENPYLLVATVLGNKNFNGKKIPHLRYIENYPCKPNNCQEYFMTLFESNDFENLRKLNDEAMAQIPNLLSSCQKFRKREKKPITKCTISLAKRYGFNELPNATIKLKSHMLTDFLVITKHNKSPHIFQYASGFRGGYLFLKPE